MTWKDQRIFQIEPVVPEISAFNKTNKQTLHHYNISTDSNPFTDLFPTTIATYTKFDAAYVVKIIPLA